MSYIVRMKYTSTYYTEEGYVKDKKKAKIFSSKEEAIKEVANLQITNETLFKQVPILQKL